MRRNYYPVLATILMMAAIATTGIGAQEQTAQAEPVTVQPQRSRDWHLRFGFLVADTTGDTSATVEPGSVNVSVSGGGGGFVSLERRVTPLLGVEFGMLGMGSDINVSASAGLKHHVDANVDVLAMGSLTLGVNFHLVDEGAIDVYAGPLISFNRYADLSVRSGVDGHWWPGDHGDWVTVRTRSDSEVGWGAKAGLDIPLGKKKRWSVGFSLTYLDATYDFERESAEGSAAISLDPLMFSFGGGFKF